MARFVRIVIVGIALATSLRAAAENAAEARPVQTCWAHDVRTKGDDFYNKPYPRPGMWRADGVMLNGFWEFTRTATDVVAVPATFDGQIVVPFGIGSAVSRVDGALGAQEKAWYRFPLELPTPWDLQHRRVLVHFKAVDDEAAVYINGKVVGRHRGGDDGFSVDITDALKPGPGTPQELAVSVVGSATSRGAHDGIWQTVWVESVAAERIENILIVPDVDGGSVRVDARCLGDAQNQMLEAVISERSEEVGRASAKVGAVLVVPIAKPHLWSPDQPFLYTIRVQLRRGEQRLDEVNSCFGMRKVAVGKDAAGIPRILLNNQFVFQAGVMDTGRWPEGGADAPVEAALRSDLEAVKQLGFNMIRKSGKVEPDYWYYMCDRLGILVWQDVAAGAVDPTQREKELRTLVAERGHWASIVAWVVGPENAARDAKLMKAIDPTRLVIAISAEGSGDVALITDAGAAGNIDRPRAIAGFSGEALLIPGHSVPAKIKSGTKQQSADVTKSFLKFWEDAAVLKKNAGLSAAVYAQLSDDETANNGLISADRELVKLDLATLAASAGKTPLRPQIKVIVPTGRADAVAGAGAWAYSEKAVEGWTKPDADASAWKNGAAPFGVQISDDSPVDTEWKTKEIWARREFTLDLQKLSNPCIVMRHSADIEVFLNNHLVVKADAGNIGYASYRMLKSMNDVLHVGRNVLAFHCRAGTTADAPRFVDVGLVDLLPQRDERLPKTLAHWPLMDAFMRDTCICLGPEGNYYLTGTTGDWGNEGIRIWKSVDLKKWDDLGLVWTPEKNATWQLRDRKRESFRLWAPEIHFINGTFWLPYCTSYVEAGSKAQSGTGLLKSISGKAEGPYVDMNPQGPLTEGLDASLFQDDDGKVYFLHGGVSIARMNDDMSGLVEKPHNLDSDGGGVGYEGISMFKKDGHYYLSSTYNGLPDRYYDCRVAIADKIGGPYKKLHLAVPHGGHNMFFKDKEGQWWSTVFGGDIYSPFVHRPGIIPVEFAADGTIHPLLSAEK